MHQLVRVQVIDGDPLRRLRHRSSQHPCSIGDGGHETIGHVVLHCVDVSVIRAAIARVTPQLRATVRINQTAMRTPEADFRTLPPMM
jgi:hypothetical protein